MPSKLGPHVLNSSAGAIRMIKAGAGILKVVGQFGLAKEALAINPTLPVIGRVYTPWDPISQGYERGMTARDAYREFMYGQGAQMEQISANPHIKLWEGPNEVVCNTSAAMQFYGAFESIRVVEMAKAGRQCVIGNFSTGNPIDLGLWPYFYQALQAVKGNGGKLGLHEYSWPIMQWMTGMGPDGKEHGWTTLRYRQVYRDYLIPAGLAVKLAITECGVDPGVQPHPDSLQSLGGAFRSGTLREVWRKGYPGLFDPQPDPDRFYTDQLIWYDKNLQKDDYVDGATIFTVGNFGGSWEQFDVAEMPVEELLVNHMRNSNVTSNPPTWAGKTIRLVGNVILRAGPDTKQPRLTALYAGSILKVQEEAGSWIRVTDNGWVTKGFSIIV